MIENKLYIGRWTVCFLFATDDYDRDLIARRLDDADAGYDIVERSNEIIVSGAYNCGFTYTNQSRRRAVVLIGPTSSGDEFQNTFVHEVRHLADAIAKSLGVPLDSERPAYISGDTAKALAEVICELGCR